MESLEQARIWLSAESATLLWLIPPVLATVAIYLLLPTIGQWRRRRGLDKILRRLGPEMLSDAVLEDGMDGLAYIDRIVAGPRGLIVVTLVPHDGIIFGGDDIDRWTRVVGRRTIKFPNPVAINREGVLAVRYHFPEAPVQGLVLFTGECTFPKGKPETALVPDEIPVPANQLQVSGPVRAIWDRLRDLAGRTADRHRSEVSIVQPDRPVARPLAGWVMLVLAGGWLGWRLML